MKKTLLILMAVAVAGLSAYTAHRTYTANNRNDSDDLLLANVEALFLPEFVGCDYVRTTSTCRIYIGAKEEIKLLGGSILEAGADGYVEFDGQVTCSAGGRTCCTMVECYDLYSTVK